jgi:NADH:ubiquinone oxidoreductase subunit K
MIIMLLVSEVGFGSINLALVLVSSIRADSRGVLQLILF